MWYDRSSFRVKNTKLYSCTFAYAHACIWTFTLDVIWSLTLVFSDLLVNSVKDVYRENSSGQLREDVLLSRAHGSESNMRRKKCCGGIIDTNNLQMLDEKRDIFYLLSFIVHNTKPVGHQVALLYQYEFSAYLFSC